MGHVEIIHVVETWALCWTLCGNVFDKCAYVLPVYIKLSITDSGQWDELKSIDVHKCS